MSDDGADHLVDEIVSRMRGLGDAHGDAVVDSLEHRILIIGDGPRDTHVPSGEVASSPARYNRIPTRDRIESREHITAFIHDYIPNESYLFDQAEGALKRAKSAVEWRKALGDNHRAVQAFNAYMDDFYHVVARMLLHGAKRPQVGMLSHMNKNFKDM